MKPFFSLWRPPGGSLEAFGRPLAEGECWLFSGFWVFFWTFLERFRTFWQVLDPAFGFGFDPSVQVLQGAGTKVTES